MTYSRLEKYVHSSVHTTHRRPRCASPRRRIRQEKSARARDPYRDASSRRIVAGTPFRNCAKNLDQRQAIPGWGGGGGGRHSFASSLNSSALADGVRAFAFSFLSSGARPQQNTGVIRSNRELTVDSVRPFHVHGFGLPCQFV